LIPDALAAALIGAPSRVVASKDITVDGEGRFGEEDLDFLAAVSASE
jgi:hypothetical protein